MKAFMLTLILWVAAFSKAQAGYELVCSGYAPQSDHKTVEVDCTNRNEVLEILKRAWRTLRQNNIGGNLETLCWEALNTAKDMHPSNTSNPMFANNFLARCNFGLEWVPNK